MKILFIIPGAGESFYCGNCFRDNLHASALRKAGHDVVIMPLYLPLKHESFRADTPLFFPAVTYYMAQKFFKNGKMPKWLQRITASNAAQNIASSMSGTTSAEGMEGMTLSMITGDDAAFRNQVSQLIDWIKKHDTPDVIHLSSTLLLGIAKAIRHEMNIPIVCSLQDEEVWIDTQEAHHASAAWHAIASNIGYISCFTASSEFYMESIHKRLPQINNIEVIYPGIDQSKYTTHDRPEHPTIGFFYRMNRDNGLHILAEAFSILKKENAVPNLKLKIGGGYTGKDKNFLKGVRRILAPFANDVELCNHYSLGDHARFYASVSIISVPVTFDEGVGLYLCEAFAAARPAIEPQAGSFPEIVGDGGLLYHPNNSNALADALKRVLTNSDLYDTLAANAKKLSDTRYCNTLLAEKLINMYKRVK